MSLLPPVDPPVDIKTWEQSYEKDPVDLEIQFPCRGFIMRKVVLQAKSLLSGELE